MANPEKLSSMTFDEASVFLAEYDAAYDVLDAQGQTNSWQIRKTLAETFFKGCSSPERELMRLRSLVASHNKPGATEVSAVTGAVADAAVRLVEMANLPISSQEPPSVTETLRPKTEMEQNYEDFEAAYALANAETAKPEFLEFETVVNGEPQLCKMPFVVAKSISIPPTRLIRIFSLSRIIRPGESI